MKTVSYIAGAVITLLLSQPAWTAEIKRHAAHKPEGQVAVPARISIMGRIAEGDAYQFFVSLLSAKTREDVPSLVMIGSSLGGDVEEAIKIGNVINDLSMQVVAGPDCFGACAVLVLSAKDRRFMGSIGLQHPYFEKANVSLGAESNADARSEKVLAHLRKNSVPDVLLERMLAPAPSSMWSMDPIEARETLGHFQPEYSQWLQGRCGVGVEGQGWSNETERCLDNAQYDAFVASYKNFRKKVDAELERRRAAKKEQ